jgi:OOP family OmpA-OmpF porin
MKTLFVSLLILITSVGSAFAQSSDFVPGGNVIFEDNFSRDPVGDFPARWSTSSGGEVVALDGYPGKWLKINGHVAVNPEIKKKLPEDCTIEFDLVVKNESCIALFGITPISDVSHGNIYYKKMAVALQNMTGYPGLVVSKDVMDVSSKSDFSMESYIDRVLHVSISVNKTRFRVYLDDTKVVDMPKLISPEYRSSFFVAGGEAIPAPPDGIYISNIRIAGGEADARRLLIKQLYDEGSVITSNVSFNPQTNEMTQQSYPTLDTLGQAMVADPNLNVQINGAEQPVQNFTQGQSTMPAMGVSNDAVVKQKVDRMKAYLVEKFNLNVDRIVTGVNNKLKTKMAVAQNSKTSAKIKGFLAEFVKL